MLLKNFKKMDIFYRDAQSKLDIPFKKLYFVHLRE